MPRPGHDQPALRVRATAVSKLSGVQTLDEQLNHCGTRMQAGCEHTEAKGNLSLTLTLTLTLTITLIVTSVRKQCQIGLAGPVSPDVCSLTTVSNNSANCSFVVLVHEV